MDKYLRPNLNNKMEYSCAACKQHIISKAYMQCGDCNETYHLICVNAGSSDTSKIKDWKCPTCRAGEPKTGNQNTPALVRDRLESPSANTVLSPLGSRAYKRPAIGSPVLEKEGVDDVQPDVATELRFLRLDMAEIKSCLISINESMATYTARLDGFESRIQSLEEGDKIISALRDEVYQLKEQINYQSQITLNNELEIIGVTETANENPVHLAMVVATKIGVSLPENEIDWVTRAGPKNRGSLASQSSYPRPIIIKLTRKLKRDELLKSAKIRRHTLTSADLDLLDSTSKIYINERLSKDNRLLFHDARRRTKDSDFRFCWVSNGKIYLRRDEGKPAIPIRNQADLDRALSECRGKTFNQTPENPAQSS